MAAKRHTLNKPEIIGKAVSLLATGETQQSVANSVGVSTASINALAAKHREAINQLALQIIQDSIAPIRQNHRDILQLSHLLLNISLGKTPINKAAQTMASLAMLNLEPKDILTLADKKEHRALQIMGITPSHAPSVVINQLFQASRSQGDSWRDLQEYGEFLAYKRDQDVQEAEITEHDEENHSKEG